MTVNILEFEEALSRAKKISGKLQILLGNGFSIGCYPGFAYGTLSEQAIKGGLPKQIEKLLSRYGNNFEEVLKYLDEGAFLANHYGLKKNKTSLIDMEEDYKLLRNLLVKTISENHPDYPSKISSDSFKRCLFFLKNFDAVFTVNYDLLLYWTAVHIKESEGERFPFKDFFGRDDDPLDPDCSFSYAGGDQQPYIFFLHGALHLYTKEGHVWKKVWKTTDVPIIQRVRDAFEKKEYPLFVSEGASIEKMKKIESSSYLYQAYRKFKNIQGHLFIFGHSLNEQDDHLVEAIIHAEKLRLNHLWVGLYGEAKEKYNQKIIQKAYAIQKKREDIVPDKLKKQGLGLLSIQFFQSQSAKVWN